jgi:hypothetical protein
VTGEPRSVLRRLLLLVCEQLAMDFAVVCTLEPGSQRTVRMAVRADGSLLDEVDGSCAPLEETWCGHVVGESPLLVDDVRLRPELDALPATAEYWIRSYAGVALHDADGAVVGTLAAIGHDRPPGPQRARRRGAARPRRGRGAAADRRARRCPAGAASARPVGHRRRREQRAGRGAPQPSAARRAARPHRPGVLVPHRPATSRRTCRRSGTR